MIFLAVNRSFFVVTKPQHRLLLFGSEKYYLLSSYDEETEDCGENNIFSNIKMLPYRQILETLYLVPEVENT